MQQLAGHDIWDENEYDRAFHERIKIRFEAITPQEVVSFLYTSGRAALEYLERFKQNPDAFVHYLELLRLNFKAGYGFEPSKAKTCAEALLNIIVMPFQTAALDYLEKGDTKMFVAYFDYISGMLEITGAILGAVSEKEGGGEKAADYGVLHSLKEVKVLPNGVAEQWHKKVLSEYLYNRQFLKKDPTGMLLLDKTLEGIIDEAEDPNKKSAGRHQKVLEHQNPTLVLTGAVIARQVYEKLYMIWEEKNTSETNSQIGS